MSIEISPDAIKEYIESECVEPYYQPIRDGKDGASFFEKFEVLARLKIEENGKPQIVPPASFIKKSENGYDLITREIIKKSFFKLNQLIERYPDKDFKFSINIQNRDISNQETIDFIKDRLEEYGLGEHIVFELSEEDSLTGENEKATRSFMETFKKYGCEFALDDFGTGYSSFHPLVAFEFDYIKFDKILIEKIYEDPKKYYLCDLLVEFSGRNGLKTVAEYVEDKKHEKALEAIGVQYFQGYLYSKPIQDVESLVAKGE